MRAFLVALSSLGALAARLAAGSPAPDQPFEPLCELDGRPAAISPLPSAHNLNAAVVALGRSLFHEPRLSADGTLSCASCHPVASGGDDARSHSVGINGQQGDINAPSLLNCAFDFRLFWDGRAGGPLTRADLGRFNQTGKEEDKHVFKVPSLRNVALTAPYFHDGSQATLEGAVRVMARVQLGRVMPDEHVQEIVAFLESLTGEIPEAP
jgi:cytochrome c peroxidase